MNFFEFLKGSINDSSNNSLVKYLPQEIRHKIWLEYAIIHFSFEDMVKNNMIDCLKYKHLLGYNIPNYVINLAIKENKFEVFELLYSINNNSCDLQAVILSDNIKIIEKVFNNNSKIQLYFTAQNSLSLEVFKYILSLERKDKIDYDKLINCCIRNTTNDDNLLYFLETYYNSFFRKEKEIIKSGKIKAIEWLHFNNYLNNSFMIMISAIESGKIDVVEFLHKCGYIDCSKNAMEIAVNNNFFDILKWLHKTYNFKCTFSLFSLSIKKENYDMAKWLYENRKDGYSSEEAIIWSCANDDLSTIKYLIEYNEDKLELKNKIIYYSTIYGGCKVLEYMYKKNKELFTTQIIKQSIEGAYNKSNLLTDKYFNQETKKFMMTSSRLI